MVTYEQKIKIMSIIISAVIAVAITNSLAKTSSSLISGYNIFTVSENITYVYLNPEINPGYAVTFERFFVAFNSPFIKNFYIKMSLDNKTWVDVPMLDIKFNSETCNENTDISYFADLDYINLNQLNSPEIKIHTLYLLPPQSLPEGVIKDLALKSVSLCIIAKPKLTSNDKTLRFILFLTLFSVILYVIDYFN